MTDTQKRLPRELQVIAGEMIDLLMAHSAGRAVAVHALAADRQGTRDQRLRWREEIEKADWLMPQISAALVIMLCARNEVRDLFIDRPETRGDIVEALVQRGRELQGRHAGKKGAPALPIEMLAAVESVKNAAWN